jgi:phage terminase small subunit
MARADEDTEPELTPRQRRFVEEYVVDLNGTQAAIRAGYSRSGASVEGSRLLANPKIQAAVAAAQEERSKRTGITADWVLQRLAAFASVDIRNVVSWGEAVPVRDPETGEESITNGVAIVDSKDLDPLTAAAITEVSQTRTGEIRVKLVDKLAALEKIGKHLGMFVDRKELSGPGGGPIDVKNVTSAKREAALALLLSEEDE